jgi:SulP family sulfate permease
LLTISNCFTYAALIFSGPLQPFLAQGIAILLVGGAVTACVIALTSGFPGAVAGPISSTSALLGVMLAGLAPMLAGQPAPAVLATVYAALALATLATGIALLALGSLRLGKAVRFVPYPVIAGFLGATGWVMVDGAVRMSTDLPLAMSSLSRFAEPRSAALLCAVIAFAAGLFLLTRWSRSPLTLPLALVAATLVTFIGLHLCDVPLSTARAEGLLFNVANRAALTIPLLSGALFQADWGAVAHVSAGIAPILVLGVLQALITATGLELALNTEADLDRELRTQGIANAAAALLGGAIGLVSTSYTRLNIDAGGRGKVSGVVVGLITLAALAGAGDVIGSIPRFALGGLLLMLGAEMFWTWGIASRRKMPLREWLLTVAIIVISVAFGLMPALLVGVFGGCLLLALSMSRIDVVGHRYGIDERPSAVQRSEDELRLLVSHGAAAQVLETEGFIFFGSAYHLYERVKDVLDAGTVRILALDFSGVTGADASAMAILGRVQALVRKAGARLMVSGLNRPATRLLRDTIDRSITCYENVDEAVEAAEEILLSTQEPRPPGAPAEEDWLVSALGDAELARDLIARLAIARFREGEILCVQGDPTDTLHFIASGRVSVLVRSQGQASVRVRVLGPQTIAGELGFFLNMPRTATLRIEREAMVGSLDRAMFQRLSQERPALVLALLSYLVRVQAERLSFTTRQITALRR